MPIVDGFTSTKMIRSFEKTQSSSCLSPRATFNGRIPIFAVSASLVEREREKYINTGFDGWILKPIDFKRVNMLLRGIVDNDARHECVYEPGAGNWEKGGWFEKREVRDDLDFYHTNTVPSGKSPTTGNDGSQETSQEGDVVAPGDRQAAQDEVDDPSGGVSTAAVETPEQTRIHSSGAPLPKKADTI